jgi:hypothetical protein
MSVIAWPKVWQHNAWQHKEQEMNRRKGYELSSLVVVDVYMHILPASASIAIWGTSLY